MSVVAFNGSARKDGNTAILIKHVLRILEEEAIETELVQLAGETVRGCNACRSCYETKDEECIIKEDRINEYVQKMKSADGIILGSPTYFSMMTPEMKALIDRTGYVARANNNLFRRKVGAAVVAVRRAGGIPTFDGINHFFLINQMIVPGSSYWNIGIGGKKGDIESDEEGIKTMEDLGSNMAWLIKKLKTRSKPKTERNKKSRRS